MDILKAADSLMYFHAYNLEVSVQEWNPQSKNHTHTHTPPTKKKEQNKKNTWEHKLYLRTVSMIPLANFVLSVGPLPSA